MNDDGFTINPKIYDFLKYVALVILPATAALVLGLGVTLSWSAAPVVAGVITLVDTFLGAILGKSASNYKNQKPYIFGDLVVTQDAEGTPTGIRMVGHQEDPVFVDRSQIILNVRREQPLQ